MSENTQAKQFPDIERRSERRLQIDKRVQSTIDWLKSLRLQVEKGLITEDQRDEHIARSMIARELHAEIAKDRNRKSPLMGILNKKAFIKDYGEMVKNGNTFALLVIDHDALRDVNNNHGHDTGDKVLMQTALNLTSNLRQLRPVDAQNDKIYLFGGDEFVILLPGVNDEKSLENVAERLRSFIGMSPYVIEAKGKEICVPVTVSIGAAINRKTDQHDAFVKADEALYEAKRQGRNKSIVARD